MAEIEIATGELMRKGLLVTLNVNGHSFKMAADGAANTVGRIKAHGDMACLGIGDWLSSEACDRLAQILSEDLDVLASPYISMQARSGRLCQG